MDCNNSIRFLLLEYTVIYMNLAIYIVDYDTAFSILLFLLLCTCFFPLQVYY